jgi:hypothetical protein
VTPPESGPQTIRNVYMLLESNDVVLMRIDTTTKYPEPPACSASKLIFRNGETVNFSNLPFDLPQTLWSISRNSIYVTIFPLDLEEDAVSVMEPESHDR